MSALITVRPRHSALSTQHPALVLFMLLLLSACSGAEKRSENFPDAPVIIISIDTLRADRLPAYGYQGVETPALDALRTDGVLFTNAYAQVPLTLPSHAGIFTGLLPTEHGVRNNIGYRLDGAKHPTIASTLKNHGYATGGAISAYVLRSATGIAEGFDFYDDAIAARPGAAQGSLQRVGGETSRILRQWIDGVKAKPFFAFLHIFEPHAPYSPPQPFALRYADAYDGEIAASDAIVGEFIAGLKEQGLYDRSLIVLLSDHGEGLGQHGEPEHGVFVYREAIHVPLIVKLPGRARAGEVVDRPVALSDVAPTILELTGTKAPGGLSLFAKTDIRRPIYSESYYGRIHLGWSELRSLIDGKHHYIEAPRPELYDLTADPRETNNILSDQRRTYAQMRNELAAIPASFGGPENVSAEERARLAALGYLGSSAGETTGALPDPKDRIGEIAAMIDATRLVTSNRVEDGLAALRAIVEKNPRLADAWTQMGQTLEREGRHQEAAETYRKAIELNPGLASEFALSLSSTLLHLDRYDEAEAHARLAESANPGRMHLLLGRIALERRDFDRAEREARLAMSDSSQQAAATIVVAQALVHRGRLGEALAMMDALQREAASKNLGPVESLELVRGDVLARMNRADEAVAAFSREIEAFPDNRQAYANLALVHLLLGRRNEAHAVLDRLGRHSPRAGTYDYIADTLEKLDDPAAAKVWRRKSAAARAL
jgi:arylsulfatase A-like enzyme/predicted Zn-dependent protease